MSAGITTGLFARLRALWRGLSRPAQLDRDMDDEMRFHIEMQAERLAREQQLDPQEARRRAFVAFGGVEKFKEEGRDTRGLAWLDAIAVDYRLAVRMLVKYPSLTLIGGFAMAVAIAIGAAAFEFLGETLEPLPIDDGHRVVAIQYATDRPGSPERRVLHEFAEWREHLTSVQDLGAFRTVEHNLMERGGLPDVIRVAETTATAFDIMRTPPLLGRYLLAADERIGAPPVMVIGHRAWQTRFSGDPAIVGRTIELGGTPHTIVGVMPEGFLFPLSHHYWTPLRVNAAAHERWKGPPLYVFGRLAPGVSMEAAQAELTTIGRRAAATYPEPERQLRAIVLPYTREHFGIDNPERVALMRAAQLLVGGLLVIVAVNLAILVYARTVMRLGELSVRSALGASRARILVQLFIEALTLSVVGAAAGLVFADVALGWIAAMLAPPVAYLPFWVQFDVSATTVGYAFALAVLAAAIVGVIPGVKTTGRQLSDYLRESSSGTGMRLGPLWTTLVVVQVAVAVAILPPVIYFVSEVVRMELSPPRFQADEYVLAEIEMDQQRQLDLVSRLEAEPRVRAVVATSSVPGYEGSRGIAFGAADGSRAVDGSEVNVLWVEPETFDVYDARILAGRGFTAQDLGDGTGTVVVNRSFARRWLGGELAVGSRFWLRQPASSRGGEWAPHQVAGIVDDFPAFPPIPASDGVPTVYFAVAAGTMASPFLTIRFTGPAPADFVGRLRRVGADLDPTKPLADVTLLTQFYRENRAPWRILSWATGLVTISVLLLSAGGIYALLSFTVAQRTREIGIRTALGAHPRRILLGVFGRVLGQIAIGLMLGSLMSGALLSRADLSVAYAAALVLSVGAIILIIGLTAALGPARRSLRVQATEALRTT